MSRTSTDALRSIQKYAAEYLPSDFDVTIAIDEDSWERPSALVDWTTPGTYQSPSPKVFDITRSFAIYAWPVRDQDNVVKSKLEAMAVEEMFVGAFQIGGALGGRPRRIPLFDYEGIGFDEGLPAEAELDGYLRLVDLTVEPRKDPGDDSAWTVVVTGRCTWRQLGEGKDELEGNTVVGIRQKATAH